jgi:glycosyltransferase involved in cell wall biosynthesis
MSEELFESIGSKPMDILAETSLPRRLQSVIDRFHASKPDYTGPVVYVLSTGYLKLSSALFENVRLPNPESHIYLLTKHRQILWALNPPIYVFQESTSRLAPPSGFALAVEDSAESYRAWRRRTGFFSLLPFRLARTAFERFFAFWKGTSSTSILNALSHPSLEQSDAIAILSNFSAGGAEKQASITVNGIARAQNLTVSEVHVFTYSPGNGSPYDQHFVGSLDTSRENFHDIATVDEERAPYELARKFGHSLDWATSLEENLAKALADVDANVVPFIEKFYWSLVNIRPRVVFCWQDYMNTVGGYAACLSGAEKIVLFTRNVSPEGMGFFQPFFRDFYLNLLEDPRVSILSNSQAGAQSYADWLDRPVDRFIVIPNIFIPPMDDYGDLPMPFLPGGRPTIVGVFQLRPEKDPALFVQVVKKVREEIPEVLAIHVGAGPVEGTFREEILKAGLQDCILTFGLRRDVSRFLGQADLMLHTASTEGLPNVFLEAQHQGVPIVTTKAGGTIEAIVPGITGDEIDSRDPSVIAAQVVLRLRDQAWRDVARQRGPAFVAEKFSEERIIRQILQYLQ